MVFPSRMNCNSELRRTARGSKPRALRERGSVEFHPLLVTVVASDGQINERRTCAFAHRVAEIVERLAASTPPVRRGEELIHRFSRGRRLAVPPGNRLF